MPPPAEASADPPPAASKVPPLIVRAEPGEGGLVAVRASWVAAFPGGRVPSLAELFALPGEPLREQRSRRIWRIPLAGGRRIFAKAYLASALEALPTLLSRTLAEREYEGLALFEAAGLPVASPVGYALERRMGLVRRAVVLMESVEGAADLLARSSAMGKRAQDASDPERAALLRALGELFRTVHARGLALGPKGAHIRNVLVAPGPADAPPRLVLVDLPNARRAEGRRLERERARDLGRLMVRLEGRFGPEGRRRFLDAYHDPRLPPRERAAIEAAAEQERRIAADETAPARARRALRRMFRRTLGLRSRPPTAGGDV